MSFLAGKRPAAATPTQLNSINVDQSRYGDPIPLVYGVQRIPMTLLWYGAFTASGTYSGSGKGGKGPVTGYNYTASCVMGLCEGPITAIDQVWKDKDLTTIGNEDLTLFPGTSSQTPWPYLTSNFPAQAVPYNLTAYVAEANLALGGSAALPNYTFEVHGFLSLPGTPITFTAGLAANAYQGTLHGASPVADGLWDVTFSDGESRTATFTTTGGVTTVVWDETLGLTFAVLPSAIAGGMDADPTAVWLDYAADPNHGAGFTATNPAIQGTGPASWQTYCIANYLMFSPWEDTQRAAIDFLKDLLEMTNSSCVMSAGVLNIVPYGDSQVIGNGRTYTPNLTPLFSFTEDDLCLNSEGTSQDPVVMKRKPLTDTYNVVRVEYLDRGNAYNIALAEWTDPLDIAVNGIRVMPNKTFHAICDARVAYNVAALIGQRQLYIRNTFEFTVRGDYSGLEPMDLVAITDSNLGLSNHLVRIVETVDDQNDIFTITAEDMFVGTASAPKYNFQAAQGYAANFAVAPFAVAVPLIFTAAPNLVGASGGYELWCAIASSGLTETGGINGDYGGCDVYGSMDTVTYSYLGSVSGMARYGAVSSAIGANDTSITISLLSAAAAEGLQLSNASASDFANNRALIYLDGEIVGFENVTLIAAGKYTLSPVSRGLFGTVPASHAVGTKWARLDEQIFKFAFDPGMVGQTMYLKMCAFNSLGRSTQLLSDAAAYPYVITESNTQPGTLNFVGSGVTVVGTSAYKSATTNAWDSSMYSTQSYTNGCSVGCYPTQTSYQVVQGFMLGLSRSPTASNSYGNLAYAWYFADPTHPNGMLQIYEGGAYRGNFGSYTKNDFFQILHDGKHVSYYHNGVLIRSVPNSNDTFYLQMAFDAANAAAYGIEFNSTATVVTPFTIVPMSSNVAAAGTHVGSNGQDYAGQFGARNFTSNESYTGGCFVSASVAQTVGALWFGLSAAPATGAAGGYGPILAGWYPHGDSSDCEILFKGSDLGSVGATPSLSDVFTITYDNFNFRWYRNNTLVMTQPYPNAGPLHLFGDFFEAGIAFNNVSFGPSNSATPAQFVARGNATVSDSMAIKASGAPTTFDSDIVSISSYSTCNLSWKVSNIAGYFNAGLSYAIRATAGDPNVSFGFTFSSSVYQIASGGETIGSTVLYLTTDRFAITYDGITIRWYQNATLIHIQALAGSAFYANVAFETVGAAINTLEWGPGATLPLTDTNQIGDNAATSLVQATFAGLSVPNSSSVNTNISSISVGPFSTATTLVITASGQWTGDATTAGACSFWFSNVSSTSSSSFAANQASYAAGGAGVLALETTVTLAANTTQTYWLNGIGLPGSGTGHGWMATSGDFRAEVIKK